MSLTSAGASNLGFMSVEESIGATPMTDYLCCTKDKDQQRDGYQLVLLLW